MIFKAARGSIFSFNLASSQVAKSASRLGSALGKRRRIAAASSSALTEAWRNPQRRNA